MRLTYTSDQGTQTIESDAAETRRTEDLNTLLFRTEAGGVVKNTAILVNGVYGNGVALMRGVSLHTEDCDIRHREQFTMDPGRPLVLTLFDGDESDYWRELAKMERGPDFAPALLSVPMMTPVLGPYRMFWGPNGYEKGGQGIDHAEGFTWRKGCWQGLQRTRQIAERTFMRNHICYLDKGCEPVYESAPHGFSYSTGTERPRGYAYDLDMATQWWNRAPELDGWKNINDQHYMRAYRDAEWLRMFDPASAWMFKNYLNHAKRAIGSDPARDHETRPYYWTVRQLRHHLERFPGSSPALGRAFSHAFGLFALGEPDGDTIREMVRCVQLASVSDPYKPPYLTTNAQEVNNIYGVPGCPWDPSTPIAQAFQWQLLLSAMKLRPGLARETHLFDEWLPKWTRWYGDGKGTWFDGPVPFMGLMRGDLGNKTEDEWLADATKLHDPEANGSNPLNYGLWPIIQGS